MNRSTPGLPVHHQLPEFTQTHVHQFGDAIQSSHPLSSPSLPAPNSSQHPGPFQWVNSSYEVAKVLEFQLQHQSFQGTPRTDHRMDWLDLLVVQGTLKSLSLFYCPTLTSIHDHWKTIALTRWTLVGKVMSLPFNMLYRCAIALHKILRSIINWEEGAWWLQHHPSQKSCLFLKIIIKEKELECWFTPRALGVSDFFYLTVLYL